MTWILYGFGGLVGLVALVAVAGALLPKGHSATRRATFKRPADEIWAAITDIEKFPSWRSGLKSVERLPDRDDRPVWRETGSMGAMTLEQVESRKPVKFVGRIVGESAFGGTWTYVLESSGATTTLAITEDGEIYNPIFRFLARFVFGHTSTTESYLRDLGRKFGESVSPQ